MSVVEKDNSLWIKTKSGEEVKLVSAEQIDVDSVAIAGHYSPETAAGKRAAGMFTAKDGSFTITLNRNSAGIWTLSHEFYHFLEAIGAISTADKLLLNQKINALMSQDPEKYGYLKGRSAAEQRAEFAGRQLTGQFDPRTPSGKIIAKIKDVMDRVLNALGIRTAGGVLRDIQSGKIYEGAARDSQKTARTNRGIPGTRHSAPQFSVAKDNPRAEGGKVTKAPPVPELLKKPDVPVTILKRDEFSGSNNISISQAREIADKHIRALQGEPLRNNDTGWDLVIAKKDRKKLVDDRASSINDIKALAGIEDIARNAVLSETHPDKKDNPFVVNVHRMYAPVMIGDILCRAKLTVKEYQSGRNNLHALEAVEIENPAAHLSDLAGQLPPRSAQPAGFSISIATLLKNARKNDGTPLLPNPSRSREAAEQDDTRYSLESAAESTETIGKKAEAVFARRVTKPLERYVSQGVRSLVGRAKPDTQPAMVRTFNQWREFWNPGATLPDADAWKAARAKGMGDVAAAMRFVENLHRKIDILPPDLKKSMFQVLDGEIPLETLPEEIVVQVPANQRWAARTRRAATQYTGFEIKNEQTVPETLRPRELAQFIRQRSDIIGEMMNDRMLITDKQLAKHKGKYVHYAYAYHVLGDDKPIGLTPSGKMDLSETLGRNPNLTPEQRRELGLIEDASVSVPLGMGKSLVDVAKFDYLNKVAENPDWVWQPSIVILPLGTRLKTPIKGRTRRLVKMTVGKLVEETKKYGEMMGQHPNPEIEEHYLVLKDALDRAQAQTKNVPADFVQLPNSRGYGPLAGAFVRKTIADDMAPVMGQINDSMGAAVRTILEIEAKAMSLFKIGKVATNIPTACRNVLSNIIQVNLSGRSLKQIFQKDGDLMRAAQSLRDKDRYYEEAFRMGMFNTNWAATEINAVMDEFRKAEGGRIDKIFIMVQELAKYYGKIDDFFKLALFRAMREEGKSIDEAAVHALKWGMDYSLASRSIKTARRHFLPFISYQYKIAPLIAEAIATRPWAIGKYALLFPLAQMLAQGLGGMDDDEWDDLQKQLPEYIKKSGSMMILPWKTDEGNWQFVKLIDKNLLSVSGSIRNGDLYVKNILTTRCELLR